MIEKLIETFKNTYSEELATIGVNDSDFDIYLTMSEDEVSNRLQILANQIEQLF